MGSSGRSWLPELMEAQLDFLKTTVLSRSDSPVTMYSDLPMTEMSKDSQFPKKWMFGMAVMLKKGLRLNMIHNVDRPFHEMMLGLESFIPMYMTGQISPYYLSGMQTSAFRHMLWVSGAAALQGDCICGHIGDGRMYLTNRKSDVAHYQKRAGQLLKRASPLMEIYGPDRNKAFDRFLQADSAETGQRRALLASLPIYALSDDLAERILGRSRILEQTAILDYVHAERQRIERILEHSTVSDVLPAISEEEFSRYPMGLSLAGMFYPGDIRLTYQEYLEYLNQCDAFAREHPGYTCRRDTNPPFRNIQITILEGSRVIVTKNKSPVIHFVIQHPKMCAAIENMVLPQTRKAKVNLYCYSVGKWGRMYRDYLWEHQPIRYNGLVDVWLSCAALLSKPMNQNDPVLPAQLLFQKTENADAGQAFGLTGVCILPECLPF